MDETTAAGDQSRLPLQGLLVVALEQAVAAPFATRQLARPRRARHQGGAARRR